MPIRAHTQRTGASACPHSQRPRRSISPSPCRWASSRSSPATGGDTVVTVSPTNPSKAVDRRGAEETRVDFDGQRLTVFGPKPRFSVIGPTESVDVRVELPAGSRLTAEIAVGGLRSSGRLGATRVKSSMGPVELDATGDLWLRARHGNATVAAASGGIEMTADHGQIRVGTVAGDAILKASHGSVTVGESGGDLDAKLSYGDLDVARALASVSAKTAYGSIQLGEVSGGSVQVESGYGQITSACGRGCPPGSTCRRRRGTCATGSTRTAPRRHPSRPSKCVRAPSTATSPCSAPLEAEDNAEKGTTSMTTPAIQARGLQKRYGDKIVLDGVDLTVAAGTVTALLGPNGAGKTTTVHILSTLLRPDGGTAAVNGCDVVRDQDGVRAAIGLTGQFSAVDSLLTGQENLELMARLRHLGAKRVEDPHRGTARTVRPHRGRAPAARHLLRRDEAPPRPRDDPRRDSERDLPRRADHGPRPAQPAHHVGHRARPGRGGHDRPAHHPATRGGG